MYDAIVVGGRCAGSPLALLLAKRGRTVLERGETAERCRCRVPPRPPQRAALAFGTSDGQLLIGANVKATEIEEFKKQGALEQYLRIVSDCAPEIPAAASVSRAAAHHGPMG